MTQEVRGEVNLLICGQPGVCLTGNSFQRFINVLSSKPVAGSGADERACDSCLELP